MREDVCFSMCLPDSWNKKQTRNYSDFLKKRVSLPSLQSGPPKVVMLQSQLKPSHCWRHTPWLAHESSWHVVLGPEYGDKLQLGEQTYILQIEPAVRLNVTPNTRKNTLSKHTCAVQTHFVFLQTLFLVQKKTTHITLFSFKNHNFRITFWISSFWVLQ